MRKEIIQNIFKDREDARLVKNKYKVLVGLIRRKYPNEYGKIDKGIWEDIAFDLVNGDRDWRLATEDYDRQEKDRLEQEYIIKNL